MAVATTKTTSLPLVALALLLLTLALAQARPASFSVGNALIQWHSADRSTDAVVADSDLDTYSKPGYMAAGRTVGVVNNFGDDDMDDDDDDDQQQQRTRTYSTVDAADDDDNYQQQQRTRTYSTVDAADDDDNYQQQQRTGTYATVDAAADDDDDDDQQQQLTGTYATVDAAAAAYDDRSEPDCDEPPAPQSGAEPVPAPDSGAVPVPEPVPAPESGAEPVPAPESGSEPVPSPESGAEPVPSPESGAEPVPSPESGSEPVPAPESVTSESGAARLGSPAQAIPSADLENAFRKVEQVLANVSAQALDVLRQLQLRDRASPLGRCAFSVAGVSQDINNSLRKLLLTPAGNLSAASLAEAQQWARQTANVQTTCASSLLRAAERSTDQSGGANGALGDGVVASASDAQLQRKLRTSYNTVVASVYSLSRIIGQPNAYTILSDLQL